MNLFHLTPASISYLNQFLLTMLITAYLFLRAFVWQHKNSSTLENLLIGFFASMTVFSALLFLDASLLPAQQLSIVYLENTILSIVLILLIQFSYHFPTSHPKQKYERWTALALSCIYTLVEAGIAVWRFSLLNHGQVEYRPSYVDYAPAFGFLWVVFIFARGALQNRNSIAGRRLALIFILPLYLTILNVLRSFYYVSTSLYHVSMSVGILFTLYFFVLNFLSSQPESTTFSAKFSGAILTSCLAVLGTIAWLITPVYAAEFSPAIIDHRSMFFSPNNMDGYTVSEIPFIFQTNFGEILPLTDSRVNPTQKINFDFSFFGRQYQDIYISNDGALGIGADIDYKDFQYNFTQSPAIFPLLLDLDPETQPDGKIYLRRESDQLVVTYDHVRSFYQPKEMYTFQVILYSNGNFSITYNGLPTLPHYHSNDRPEASIWAIGVKPAQAPDQPNNFLTLPFESGPDGIIQDEYLSFRQYQHRFLLPLAITIFTSSLALLLSVPLVINYSLAQPLKSLLDGISSMNQGNLNVIIPVQFNDEIGYLTNAFNHLNADLNNLFMELENRVSARTSDLVAINEQYRKLSVAVEQSPSTIVITDLTPNIEYTNPAFTKSTGYTFEEVKGKNPHILKSNLTPPEVYREMWEDLTAGRSWRGELINKKKDGQIFWEYTVITPIQNIHGTLTHYVAIKEDVTGRVLAEQALRESEEQYRLLFDLESDAIFIIRNEDGQILEANKAAISLYGYTRGELLSSKNTDLSAEPESTKSATTMHLPSDQVIAIPLRYHRKKDGTIFPVEITARFVTWEGQSVHIAAMRDITERKQIEEELVKLSITDPLTEVSNRRYFYIQAEQIFNRIQHPSDALAILMLDIDHFKQVNDTHGHGAGDAILHQLANRLKQNLRPTDILARYGGEEFVILLPRTPNSESALIAERLWRAMEEDSFKIGNKTIQVTISIGVANLDQDTQDIDALMRHADQALYQAKQAGRNQIKIWKPNS
ncbi:MAG: diguanylate cyclase [Anaerolineales bacterium]|nr:diguanylate cyclase [Anaerolineales bacterium]